MSEWSSDEAFWAAAYPFMFPETSFARAARQVDEILALTACQGHVLDLACGPGRHSVPLAERGCTVTGVDRTTFLLEKARSLAAATGVEIEWVQSDMRNFQRPDMYDLALSLFTSFGYFSSPGENQRVLENVYESLKPGGSFVLDVVGKEVLARIFQPTDSQELPETGLVVQRRRVIDGWSRIENDWILIREGSTRAFRFEHWLYSGQELKGMLASAGFAEIELYGDFEGAAYGPEANRLIAVARKAA